MPETPISPEQPLIDSLLQISGVHDAWVGPTHITVLADDPAQSRTAIERQRPRGRRLKIIRFVGEEMQRVFVQIMERLLDVADQVTHEGGALSLALPECYFIVNPEETGSHSLTIRVRGENIHAIAHIARAVMPNFQSVTIESDDLELLIDRTDSTDEIERQLEADCD